MEAKNGYHFLFKQPGGLPGSPDTLPPGPAPSSGARMEGILYYCQEIFDKLEGENALIGAYYYGMTTKINPIFGKSLANFVVGDGKT